MHTTFGYLFAKPRDFKVCLRCGQINWYENEECISCGGKKFREATLKDIEEIAEAWKQSGHFCMECEMDT